MLLIDRKLGEKICIGDNIVIEIVPTHDQRRHGTSVCIGITAPKEIPIERSEIREKLDRSSD